MSEIYRIIPEKERAYEWAHRQQMRYFEKPEVFHLVDLDKLDMSPHTTVSIFHKEGGGGKKDPDIIRVEWHDKGCFKYSILSNYSEIKEKCPAIVKMLEQNAQIAYDVALHQKTSETIGLDEDLMPLKRIDP